MVRRILLLAAALLPGGFVSAGIPEDPLVGVWHLDEGGGARILDATVRENDGDVHGGAWIGGVSGKALQLDGKEEYVALPGIEALREATVELWVKVPSPAAAQGALVCFGRAYGGRSDVAVLGFGMHGAKAGVLSLAAYGSEWIQAPSQVPLPAGEWCHVAGVFSTDGLRLYVNGRLAATSNAWKGGLPAHEAVLVGAGSWGSHLACSVDELRLYRKALPEAEIARHASDRRYPAQPPQPPACCFEDGRQAVHSSSDRALPR